MFGWFVYFFFFKQKTAYEMRISDWSSDVCSSDLPGNGLLNVREFVQRPEALRVMFDLFGVAVAGGMFVVPLYAFLQITVPPSATARTIAANNIVNSAFMVLAALLAALMAMLEFSVAVVLLLVAVDGKSVGEGKG